jgi:hypothetical protein
VLLPLPPLLLTPWEAIATTTKPTTSKHVAKHAAAATRHTAHATASKEHVEHLKRVHAWPTTTEVHAWITAATGMPAPRAPLQTLLPKLIILAPLVRV